MPPELHADAHAVIDSHIDSDGRLRPIPRRPGVASQTLSRREQLVDELRSNAWSPATLRAYGGHVRAWQRWCRDAGRRPLPMSPGDVAEYLAVTAFKWGEDDQPLRGLDGDHLAAVTAGTVRMRLSSLNALAAFTSTPVPGDSPDVSQVMRALRRRLHVASRHAKAALDLSAVDRLVRQPSEAELARLKTVAGVLLRASFGATAGELSSLRKVDVRLHHDGAVEVLLPQQGPRQIAAGAPLQERVREVLTRLLKSGGAGSDALLLARGDGQPQTRQAVHLAVSRLAAAVGSSWEGLPALTDSQVHRVLRVVAGEHPAESRNRALLLTAFFGALRRSNVVALHWGDLDDLGTDGFRMVLRRSKTDQEGAGHTVWLPQADPARGVGTCPSAALREWRGVLEELLERPLEPGDPVFTAVDRHGRLRKDQAGRPARLSGAAVNELVQRLAQATGEPGAAASESERSRYGAHSLRAGFVTEALRGDRLSIPEVAEVTAHKDPRVLLRYRREVQGATVNPARRLLLPDTREAEQ